MPDPLSNRRRKQIASLTRRRYRERYGQTLLESPRLLASALDAGAPLVDVVVTADALRRPEIQSLLDRCPAPVYVADDETMSDLADVSTHQGLVAVVERHYVDDMVEQIGVDGTMLVLDRVQDPGNVGTILRTAAWFGADAVAAGPGTAGLYGPKVMRAAAGGHWDLLISRTDDLGPFLDRLRRAGFALYGADLQGTPADLWSPERPSALVLGSEAHGLSASVLNRLGESVALPGRPRHGSTESLNVAVASGLLVYEWIGTG